MKGRHRAKLGADHCCRGIHILRAVGLLWKVPRMLQIVQTRHCWRAAWTFRMSFVKDKGTGEDVAECEIPFCAADSRPMGRS